MPFPLRGAKATCIDVEGLKRKRTVCAHEFSVAKGHKSARPQIECCLALLWTYN